MQTNSMLSRFLKEKAGKVFYRFSNADGKTWIMPAQNMRVAMNLYQPSGRNGKLVKALFPWLHRFALVRKIIHAEVVHVELREEAGLLLQQLFGVDNPEFSIFCGTPCVHQKITMQISKGERILGYCKLTDNAEVACLFEREKEILHSLERQGVTGAPLCLFCGKEAGGLHLFVQTTMKTHRSKTVHEWAPCHEKFLFELQTKTHQRLLFEDTDYYRTLKELEAHLDWLPDFVERSCVETALLQLFDRYNGRQVDFSAYHADFTPWNMFLEGDRLFVFDWEYARMTYPPQLDRYHFLTQTAIFERHWQSKEIIGYMQSEEGKWVDRQSYVLYLLDIISRFCIRERGLFHGDILNSMKIWSELLKYIVAHQ